MKRVVISVATTSHYQKGMARLMDALGKFGAGAHGCSWPSIPSAWRSHEDIQYGFKAFALRHVADAGADALLWADASVLPIRDMTPLWEKIERDGYWIARNYGIRNETWTAESALLELFPNAPSLDQARHVNKGIEHVIATSFGLSMKHEIGREFLDRYYRLASETKAFCGPWTGGVGVQHRHDQTCASVVAWELGMQLTDPPLYFDYKYEAGRPQDESTVIIADGAY